MLLLLVGPLIDATRVAAVTVARGGLHSSLVAGCVRVVVVWVRWAEGSEFVSLCPKLCFFAGNSEAPLSKTTTGLGCMKRPHLS